MAVRHRQGTTYICCGSGGRPRYGWQPGETDRYRGSTTPDAAVTSFVVGPNGSKKPETVEWSQSRYLDYAFLAVQVTPAPLGQTTRMSVRAITDSGTEIDRVDLTRTAGRTEAHTTPAATPSSWRTHQRTGLSVPGHVPVTPA